MTNAAPSAAHAAPINNRREIFGWQMYDWANSGFTTTIVAALAGPYLTALAQSAADKTADKLLHFGPLALPAGSLFAYATSLSVLLQVFFLPLLGAIADYTNLKKPLLVFFCALGSIATALLFFVQGNLYLLGGLLFVIANLSFGASIVFYNAFLPDITTEDQRDKVSSRGFALGYLGGGVLLALNLVAVTWAQGLADPAESARMTGLAVRASLGSAGLWWLGFSLITFKLLKKRGAAKALPAGQSYAKIGFSQVAESFRELRRLPSTLKYLVGYLFFNDAIQTVIGLSSLFLTQELFVNKGQPASKATAFLLSLVLMIQFVAFLGALIFERIARWVGAKRAILISLAIWCGVVIYAYGFLQTTTQAYVMGAVIAIVLGGSQALSRSLFSQMIPAGREASFFGFYEISERGTAWMGSFIFATVVALTGSYRQALLSLIILFIVGMAILFTTDTARAVREAGNQPADGAGEPLARPA